MFVRVSRCEKHVVRLAKLRGMAARAPIRSRPRMDPRRDVGDERKRFAPMSLEDGPLDLSYAQWQKKVIPQLPSLDHEELRRVLLKAEHLVPLLPLRDFMDAWLSAARAAMEKMPLASWALAAKLGARPDKGFFDEFVATMARKQRASMDFVMFDIVEVMQKWGGTAETMKPFLTVWEAANVEKMRSDGLVHYRVVTVLSHLGYVPSAAYLQEWVRVAMGRLPHTLEKPDGIAFWNLASAAALLPTEDLSVTRALLEAWANERPRCEGVEGKILVNSLIRLADVSFRPPADWIESVANELWERLPELDLAVVLMPLSLLVTPSRDVNAVAELAQTWAEMTIKSVKGWQPHVLGNTLASLVRMQMGPSVIGKDWYRAWLRAARSFDTLPEAAMAADVDSYNEAELLVKCHDALTHIFKPIEWKDKSLSSATRASRVIRQLQDMRTLQLNHRNMAAWWLACAKDCVPFRRHQVELVSQLLRDVGAHQQVAEWEAISRRTQ